MCRTPRAPAETVCRRCGLDLDRWRRGLVGGTETYWRRRLADGSGVARVYLGERRCPSCGPMKPGPFPEGVLYCGSCGKAAPGAEECRAEMAFSWWKAAAGFGGLAVLSALAASVFLEENPGRFLLLCLWTIGILAASVPLWLPFSGRRLPLPVALGLLAAPGLADGFGGFALAGFGVAVLLLARRVAGPYRKYFELVHYKG